MSEDWGSIDAEVTEALESVGTTATLLRNGAVTGPEWDPAIGPDTEHPVTVMQDTLGLELINGSTIRASDVRVMMAAKGVIPTTADKLRMGDVVYAIERAENPSRLVAWRFISM